MKLSLGKIKVHKKSQLFNDTITSFEVNKKIIFVVILFCFFSSIVDAYLLRDISIFIGVFSDFSQNDFNDIKNICILIFCLAFLSGFLRIFLSWLIPYTASSIITKITNLTSLDFAKIENIKLIKFSKEELVDTLTTQSALASLAIRQILFIIFNLFTLISVFVMATSLAPKVMFLATATLFLCYLFIYRIISSKILKYSSYYSTINIKLLSEVTSMIDNYFLYNLFPIKRKVHKDIFESNKLLKKTDVNSAFLSTFPRYAIESIGIMLLAVIPYILSDSKEITASSDILLSLGILAFSVQKLLPAAQGLYSSITDVKTKEISLNRLINLFKISQKEAINLNLFDINPVQINTLELRKTIVQPPQNNSVSINVDLKIERGDSIAIIGKTGSGKSSIINSILFNYPLKRGDIIVNSQVIRPKSEDYFNFRSSISYVPQASTIIGGGLKENIAFQRVITEEDEYFYRLCCKLACIDNSLRIDLESNEDLNYGKNLSGGQIQRIAIARALFQRRSILVLDESTSALDRKTQNNILSNIIDFYNDKILITITHRLETLNMFQRILEIKKGCLLEKK